MHGLCHMLHAPNARAAATLPTPLAADKEFRELSRDEEELLRTAERAPGGTPIAEHSLELVHSLYRRQLVYIEVPVSGDQRFSTSSLDGFVSNRDLVAGDSDPMEALLYEVFVSNSERLRLQELADVLEKGLTVIQQAMSIAVRMGFAVLMDGAPHATPASWPLHYVPYGLRDDVHRAVTSPVRNMRRQAQSARLVCRARRGRGGRGRHGGFHGPAGLGGTGARGCDPP